MTGALVAATAYSTPGTAQTDALASRLGGLRGKVVGRQSALTPRSGEGATIRLKNGVLLHAFGQQILPAHPKKYFNQDVWPAIIVASSSSDDGRTWSSPKLLMRGGVGDNAMQPSFVRMKNGELGIAYSEIESFSRARKVFRYSDDDGKTWSPEIPITPPTGYWTSAHDRLALLPSGRMLLTTQHKKQVLPTIMVTQVSYSDDNGRSWHLSPDELAAPAAIPAFLEQHGRRSVSSFVEASIAQRADGSLLMIGRTLTGWLYQSLSYDDGVRWTPPARTSLRSPAAPAKLARIPGSADLLIIWNSCCLDTRSGVLGQRLTLSSAISSDGGQTWHWRRDVESVNPGAQVSYPSLTFVDNDAFLAYRAGSGDTMQEYMSVLPLDWFSAARDEDHPGEALP